jgi:hypothetical protein
MGWIGKDSSGTTALIAEGSVLHEKVTAARTLKSIGEYRESRRDSDVEGFRLFFWLYWY